MSRSSYVLDTHHNPKASFQSLFAADTIFDVILLKPPSLALPAARMTADPAGLWNLPATK